MNQTSYFGVRALKSPMDHWIYQEIIFETRPDVIVEIGNANGGGTLCLAHLCDLLGKGRVIGLDLSHAAVPPQVRQHPRITFIEGDACRSFGRVERMIAKDERVLVIEDSSHTYENTLNVLRTYSVLVKPGNYFIVEDGICHHGLSVGPEPGPYEAIETFVRENPDFAIDRNRESFLITWNPKGYLRRTGLTSKA
jgi:cephalosporin hydroxylase